MTAIEFLASKEPLKVVTLTFTNKEFEQAIHSMILEETGVDLVININSEWGSPYIMLYVPEWENGGLTDIQRKALDENAYSFDFPDEDFTYLLERFFKTEDLDVVIEAQRRDMVDEKTFDIQITLQLDYYESLFTKDTSKNN